MRRGAGSRVPGATASARRRCRPRDLGQRREGLGRRRTPAGEEAGRGGHAHVGRVVFAHHSFEHLTRRRVIGERRQRPGRRGAYGRVLVRERPDEGVACLRSTPSGLAERRGDDATRLRIPVRQGVDEDFRPALGVGPGRDRRKGVGDGVPDGGAVVAEMDQQGA